MIKRPYFQFGATLAYKQAPPLKDIITKRMGTGNYNIKRDNFSQSEAKPRNPRFDDYHIKGLEKRGSDRGLGDKTLSELFSVDVPDPSDSVWLAEKRRLITKYEGDGIMPEQIKIELMSHKPLGRDQRKIRKQDNVATSALSFNKKLEEMEQEIREGRAVDSGKLALIEGQLNGILASTSDISSMTQQQLGELANMLEALHIPRTHEEMGLPRIIGTSYYKDNAGIVNMFLLKNAENDANLSLNRPIMGITNKPMSLNSMVSGMGANGDRKLFLDLGKRQMLNIQMLPGVANDIGFENSAIQLSENEWNSLTMSGAEAESVSSEAEAESVSPEEDSVSSNPIFQLSPSPNQSATTPTALNFTTQSPASNTTTTTTQNVREINKLKNKLKQWEANKAKLKAYTNPEGMKRIDRQIKKATKELKDLTG
jgi:hypothetical protein